MRLEDAKVGQLVRFNHHGAQREGQVYSISQTEAPGVVSITFFSSLHRGWVIKTFRPEQLEPLEDAH